MSEKQEELIKEAIKEAASKAAENAKDKDADKKVSGEAENTDANAENGSEVNGSEEKNADVQENDTPAEESANPGNEEGIEDTEAAGRKKPLFGKKDKKDKRDEQIADLTDKLKRNLADFENFRKRTEREKSQMFEIGAKSVIEKILPTVDNFERGLATVPEDKKEDPFVQGMEKIYRQLMTTLEEIGVKPIEAVGQPFDPNFHNAVMHEDNEELGENVVSEEFQKGYMYHDSVVRHSMVKVAN